MTRLAPKTAGTSGALSQLVGNSLARNSLWMVVGQGFRAVVQAAYFVCIARALGVTGYGAFLGVTALVGILAPFSGWGAGTLLVQHASRDPGAFRTWWGYAIQLTLVTGVALILLTTALARLVLPLSIPLALMLSIGAADLVFQRLVDVAGQAYQALHRLSRSAQLQFLPGVVRLLGAVPLLLLGVDSPTHWGLLYLASTALCAIGAIVVASAELGRPHLRLRLRMEQGRQGFLYCLSISALSVNNDADKTLLARLGELSAVGAYGAAYRIIDVAYVPVRSLLYAAHPRFFAHGDRGIGATLAYARRLTPLVAGYALVAGASLYFAAPLLPWVLGAEFAVSVDAVRWLAILPLIRTTHHFGGESLTGANRQGLRSAILVAFAIGNVGLNLWLIPIYSWRGAAMASIACEAALALTMWGSAWLLLRRASRPGPRAGARA